MNGQINGDCLMSVPTTTFSVYISKYYLFVYYLLFIRVLNTIYQNIIYKKKCISNIIFSLPQLNKYILGLYLKSNLRIIL